MKALKYFVFISVLQSTFCFAQETSYSIEKVKENYSQTFSDLNNMLNGNMPLSFKRAVYITENSFFQNKLEYKEYCNSIDEIVNLCRALIKNRRLLYDQEDSIKVQMHAAIFVALKDSIKILIDTANYFYTKPFTYDFDDVWGDSTWSSMLVTKLLITHKGNCHSLPFLYKIIAQELGDEAYLSFAPNHIYIKLRNKKDGWYNTELTSGYFPIDAWLMASGYIHLSAIQNAIYMDTLSNQQSVAVCMIDLAHGFQKQVGNGSEQFVLQCCDTALKYYPNYINALLLKAEIEKKLFELMMQKQNATYPKEMFNNPEAKSVFDQMQTLYASIHKLGYRTMPKEMYLDWLVSLKTEKEKYQNKNISNFTNIMN
jgi:hypothetical protein